MKPRLLDLFCGAGGAGMGYARAGFEVVGVDLADQPNYPFEFHRADAMTWPLDGFDAIHASPPCQAYSALRVQHPERGHPDLVAPVRARLEAAGVPWVMENVPGAPLRHQVVLCGSMFGLGARCGDGRWRQLRRHRLFETPVSMLTPPCAHRGEAIGVYGNTGLGATRGYVGVQVEAAAAMGVDWMTRRELVLAVPPAYTEYIGGVLIGHLAAMAGVS